MIIKTNWLVPKGFSAFTLGAVIFIKPDKVDDIGLLAHEMTHVEQFWDCFPLFWWFYLFVPKARLKLEVEAYRVQLGYSKDKERSARWFAKRISEGYRLTVTPEVAYQLLTKE